MLRGKLSAWIQSIDDKRGPTLKTLSMPSYAAPDAELVKETERFLLVSYLLGKDHASSPLDLDDGDFDAVPYDDAIAFLKARVPVTKAEWSALEERMRFRAFTVAALATPDTIERIRKRAITALERGETLSEFWESSQLTSAAGLGSSPWYWETVFRTNAQTAYNAGRAAEFTRNQPSYLEFIGIEDSRQTTICAERSGIILPSTHPFWKTNWPPLHFICRSTVRALYPEEVKALRERDPEWSPSPEEELPSGMAAGGFGQNPIQEDTFWEMTQAMRDRAEKYGILPEIQRFRATLRLKEVAIDTAITVPNTYEAIRQRLSVPLESEEALVEVGTLIMEQAAKDSATGEASADHVWEILKKIRPFASNRSGHAFVKGSSVQGRALLAKAQASFPEAWVHLSERASKAQALHVKFSQARSYYIPGWAQIKINDRLETVAHELAHRMEEVVPGVKEMEKAFYERRTKGESLRTLRSLTGISGYKPNEVARKDRFLSPYMGRDYKGAAYEILSMGIESLLGGYYNILKDDPDYAAFIIGLLAGV